MEHETSAISESSALEHYRAYGVGLRLIDRREASDTALRGMAIGAIYDLLQRGIFSHRARRIRENEWEISPAVRSGLEDAGLWPLAQHLGFRITVVDAP